ncbi:hypothetical protein K438DRAFT_2011178 [Mycena galopus ATCC 62051]|nr:hypothetical protein K438DRAFT_2011178 [Mycena galopus ATCC 62051]
MITPRGDQKTRQSDAEIPQAQATESNQPPSSGAPPYTTITETEWKEKLQKLEGRIRKYNWMKRGDEPAIVEAMRDLAASHNDPQVQAYWTRRADEFEKAPDSDKKAILKDIVQGLAILVSAPFIIAGAIFTGTGMVLKTVGNVLTGGSKFFTK